MAAGGEMGSCRPRKRSHRAWLAAGLFTSAILFAAACQALFTDSGAGDGPQQCDRPETGCPCVPGHVLACYSDAPLTDEAGEQYCLEGVRRCLADGTWGECELGDGARRLAVEYPSELCPGCDPACHATESIPDDDDLTEENSSNVYYDGVRDGLVIGGGTSGGTHYAFVANSPESTLSKVNLQTGIEEGRYLVGLPGGRCTCWCDGCNHPSRTAVDALGFGYVASRAFGGQGSVTKIAGELRYCLDRNGNGAIDTSAGGHDVRPWGTDECVLWTVEVGERDCIPCAADCVDDPDECDWGTNPSCLPCGAGCSADPSCVRSGVPRALAVDAEDRLWVGNYFEKRFYVLDISDGALIRHVDVDLRPYGAAIGPRGKVWFPDGCCGPRPIQYVDANTFTKGDIYDNTGPCPGSYGIVVDKAGRVILGGWPENCVSRFDPATKTWELLDVDHATGGTRGVTLDAEGGVWTASHNLKHAKGTDWITRFPPAGGEENFTTRACAIPIGLAADFWGWMWGVCRTTNNLIKLPVDVDASSKAYYTDVGVGPYTYSDFTGFLRATITAPEGHYLRIHDSALSCAVGTDPLWSQLYYDVETPPDTQIRFWGRTFDDPGELVMAPEFLIAEVPHEVSPADVRDVMSRAGIDNGQRYMDVRVELRSLGGAESPLFREMNLVHYCICSCDVDMNCTPGCACDDDC